MKTARLFTIFCRYLALGLGAFLALSAAFGLSGQVAAQSEGTIEIDISPDIVPVLSIVHNNTLLEVSATDNNLKEDSWQNVGPLDYEPDCRYDNLDYGSSSASARHLTLTESDNGKWYCFKASDGDGNVGYARYQVTGVVVVIEEAPMEDEQTPQATPIAAPKVVVDQVDDILQASSEEDLLDPVWQALLVDSLAGCAAGAFDQANSWQIASSRRIIGLTWNDNGRIYCFRVSDSGENHGYGAIVIGGLSAPVVAVPVSVPPVTTPAPTAAPVAVSNIPAGDDGEDKDDGQSDEAEDDDDEHDDDDESSDDKQAGEGDKDDDAASDNLRLVGVAIVVAGVMALIGVLIFSRKQSGSDKEVEDEEL